MNEYVQTRLLRNAFREEEENMIELSQHPDLTLEVLLKTPMKAWAFHTLHNHPNFTFDWVVHFTDRFWDWNRLSQIVTLETLVKYPNLFWNWRLITDRMSVDVIMDNPNLPWDFNMLYIREIRSEHIPFLEMFRDRLPPWKWSRFAKCTNWTTFKSSLHLPWLWYASDINISTDEFLEEDVFIIKEFDILFNWIKLTINVHINIINAHPELYWVREFIQWNQSSWKTPVEPIEVCIRKWTAANTIKRHWKRAISVPRFKMCRDRLLREFKELVQEESTMAVSFYKLRPDAIIPSKATPGSIGLDLYSVEPYIVLPGQRIVVSTGLKVQLPDGVYGRIAPRSGLAVKHGLDVGAGVIDPDYTGELRVVLFNHDQNVPFIVRPGYRIAQLILERALEPSVNELTEDPSSSSTSTDRGDNGFGSSGVA